MIFFLLCFCSLLAFFFNTVDTKKLTGIWILAGLLVYYYQYTLPGGQNKVTGDLIFFFQERYEQLTLSMRQAVNFRPCQDILRSKLLISRVHSKLDNKMSLGIPTRAGFELQQMIKKFCCQCMWPQSVDCLWDDNSQFSIYTLLIPIQTASQNLGEFLS